VFYYYGGKTRSAGRYPAPLHTLIVEPFAGSAGYGIHHLRRDPSLHLLLVEKDPEIAALWRRILLMTPEEIEEWPIPAVGEDTRDRFVILAAASNGASQCRRMRVSERVHKEASRQRRKVSEAMRLCGGRVEIIEGDYTLAPDVPATWFIDPPYQIPADYSGKASRPAGMGYATGCNTASTDYPALADWIMGRQGQVIACEYATATWLPFRKLNDTANTIGRRYAEGIFTRGGATDKHTDSQSDKRKKND